MSHTTGWLPRFTIRTLLLLVALACVALATTVSASEPVLHGIRLLSAILIPVAILLAIYLEGMSRAFWTGFAVLAVWSHLFLFTEESARNLIWTPLRSMYDKHLASSVADLHPDWIEARSQMIAQSRWGEPPRLTDKFIQARVAADLPEIAKGVRNSVAGRAFNIAQHHIQIWISILGGFLACWLYQLRERRNQPRSG